MMVWLVVVFAVATVTAGAAVPLPRKVVLDGDNLEILRLDIMSMEVRVSNNVKELSDRVVAALDRHGAKLDELWADHRRPSEQMATAWLKQEGRLELLEAVVRWLVNSSAYQVDITPILHVLETLVKELRQEAHESAQVALAAKAAADEAKVAAAATSSSKAEVVPGF
jgi:hypothetical protein